MSSRKNIRRHVDVSNSFIYDNDLSTVACKIDEWRKQHGDKATLELEIDYEYGDHYAHVYLSYFSPETDAERSERLLRAQRIADAVLAKEKADYRRLKAKFEKS